MAGPTRHHQRRRAQELRDLGWSHTEIGRALAAEFALSGLPAMRLAHGWSQAEAADRWNHRWPDLTSPVTAKWISERECWPISGREPHVRDLVRFAHLYGCRVADLLAGVDEHFAPAGAEATGDGYREPPVRRRELLAGLIGTGVAAALPPLPAGAAPARVGMSDVARLHADLEALVRLEQQQGGAQVYRAVSARLAVAQDLLGRSSYSPAVGRELRALTGRIHRDLGWCAFDAGRQELARRHYAEALAAAAVADDRPLQVFVLQGMSHQSWASGDGREAVAQADAAVHAARGFASDRLLSLLTKDVARAQARAGEPAEASFAAAERLYADHDADRDPAWMAYYDPAAFHVTVATAQLGSGHAHAAAITFGKAVAEKDHGRFPRDVASASSWRALALATAGELDEAAAVVVETVGLLGAIDSPRVRDRLASLVPAFAANRAVPGVEAALAALT